MPQVSRINPPGIEKANAAGEVDQTVAFDVPQFSILDLCHEEVLKHGDAARRRSVLARQPVGVKPLTRVGLRLQGVGRMAGARDDRSTDLSSAA
jgi:hypothetical protein